MLVAFMIMGIALPLLAAGLTFYIVSLRQFKSGTPAAATAEPDAAQQQFDDGDALPQLRALAAAQNPLPPGGSTTLEALIHNPDDATYHTFWTASCGAVAPLPDDASRAVYLSPSDGRTCQITITLRSHNMRKTTALHIALVAQAPTTATPNPGGAP
jgi:hypothetical protein